MSESKEEEMSNTTINHIATVFPVDPEMWKSKAKIRRSRSIIKDYSLNTSTHGIPGIARSESRYNCLFWTISVIIFTGLMLYFVIKSVSAYFQYPVQTLVSFYDEWPQVFPAVTICNYSPLRYDRFIGPFLNYTNTFNLTNTTDTSTFSPEQAQYILPYLQYKLNRNESLDDFYYSLDSMLIKCVYNGGNCSATDFIQFTSPVYGLCYTFNAFSTESNSSTLRYNNEYGDSGELQLDLYVHSHQYVPYFYDGVGIVIMLHNNTELPLVDLVGIELTPGQKHKLGYYKKTNQFIPSPYSTCSTEITPGMQAMFDQFSGADYTYGEEVCFEVALQTYTYQECGCVSPYEWDARYVVPSGTTTVVCAPLCNMSSSCYSDAADRFQSSNSISNQFAADCGLECLSIAFPLKLSSVSAPPNWYIYDIKQFVESSSVPLPTNWSTTWPSEIQANYVGVDVVCESTQVESYAQQATLGAVDVVSNVGGQTGLWIGLSFLSLMEIAEMFYRLIRYQWHQIREKIRKIKAKQVAEDQSINDLL